MPAARTSHALLSIVRCSVHGIIDLTDVRLDSQVISQLVVSTPVQRLRRIKQLGFASLEFTGADHSRFSHALGTMHVMRMILGNSGDKTFLDSLAAELHNESHRSRENAAQHMLVAALLQDCGELPYGVATSALIRPSQEVLDLVRELTDEDASNWPSKAVFGIACLDDLQDVLADLDIEAIAYLMTGRYWSKDRPNLRAAMHLLDGVLDADRIDYVRRDAHHTGHGQVDVKAIVDSIKDVDGDGPICTDPAQVASLLALRAHLYSTVYYSAPNRFRVMLLREFLRDVAFSPSTELRTEVLGADDLTLNYQRFLELDDVEIERYIANAARSKDKSALGTRARIALDILTGASNNFRERWLLTEPPPPDGQLVPLPGKVFAEFFEPTAHEDQRRVRIRLNPEGTEVELDALNGPYSRVVIDHRAQLPIQGDVLVFEPTRFKGPNVYRSALDEGWLGAGIKAGLVASGQVRNPDTRRIPGFDGPAIFISYCTEDIGLASAVTDELYRRRRRYYILAGDYQGVGGTPGANSEEAPSETEACVMITSPAYQDRLTERTTGNIAKEVRRIIERRQSGCYPLVALATTHFNDLDRMPWSLLGFEEAPFVGKPLSALDAGAVRSAVDAAIQRIDKEVRTP